MGVLVSVGAATCESTSAPTSSVGVGPQDLVAVTWTRRLSSALRIATLSGYFPHRSLPIAQWFVHLSAYPQPMQQHRQFSRHRHHRSLLGIFPSSLGQLQSPAPQIAVFSKRPQNVMRSLHQHRSQIPVTLFADALLWFALPRVPASGS